MKFRRILPLLVLVLIAMRGPCSAQGQNKVQPQPDNSVDRPTPLRLINSPTDRFTDEARKRNIEGKVALSLVVEANGKVSEAKPISGSPELFQAAIDSVKLWQFEHPAYSPTETTMEISYFHPKECPGPISASGTVFTSGRLLNGNGEGIAVWADTRYELPQYFEEDRKAGIVGNIVLSVTLDAEGNVTETHIVKSLSTHLDEAAIETVRKWKFRPLAGDSGGVRDGLHLDITYKAMCDLQF